MKTPERPFFLIGTIILLLLPAPFGNAAERPPNIIYMLADDLGYGDLGCYGQKKIKTPNLDQMAAEGMKFTQHYSGNTVCAPSRCSLLTGKHPGNAYIRNNGNPKGRPKPKPEKLQFPGQHPIPDSETTIAELLKEKGYKTAAIGKWGLGYAGSSGDPNKQGFDLFYGFNCQIHAHNHYPRFLERNGRKELLAGNSRSLYGDTHSEDKFAETTIRFIQRNKDKPFFIYLAFAIPHLALQASDKHLAQYKDLLPERIYKASPHDKYVQHPYARAAYAAMISHMDEDIGKILAELKRLRRDKRTLVIFSSDNGPVTQDFGGADPEFFNSNGPLTGLKRSLYEGGIRVPMIARWPGKITPGTESDHISAFWDVLPTITELTGARTPKDINGISFAPTLLGKAKEQKQHEYLYWEYNRYQQQAVRMGSWKAIRYSDPKYQNDNTDRSPPEVDKIALYNLDDDIQESINLADKKPEILSKIIAVMNQAHTPSSLFPMNKIDKTQ